MPRIITIEEKPDSFRIWRNGQLIVNFHDAGFLVAQQQYGPDILTSILCVYPGLLEDFIKQIRLDGKLPTGPAPQSEPSALPDGVMYHDLPEWWKDQIGIPDPGHIIRIMAYGHDPEEGQQQ